MKKQKIDGLLLLNKPFAMTSHDALLQVKRIVQPQKLGHTGSLDPLATGMLPICFGEAAKFSQFLLDADKKYVVTAQLGIRTTTSDAEGEIVEEKIIPTWSDEELENHLAKFRGEIAQIPSMYSALKYQGMPLYFYARQGITIPREARNITIYELKLIARTEDTITLSVHCSKGTYIRTLIDDLGEQLGCGAHVSSLHRLAVASFTPEQMISLEVLKNNSAEIFKNNLLPIETIFSNWSQVHLTPEIWGKVRTGQTILLNDAVEVGPVVLFANSKFAGVAEVKEEGLLKPKRLIAF